MKTYLFAFLSILLLNFKIVGQNPLTSKTSIGFISGQVTDFVNEKPIPNCQIHIFKRIVDVDKSGNISIRSMNEVVDLNQVVKTNSLGEYNLNIPVDQGSNYFLVRCNNKEYDGMTNLFVEVTQGVTTKLNFQLKKLFPSQEELILIENKINNKKQEMENEKSSDLQNYPLTDRSFLNKNNIQSRQLSANCNYTVPMKVNVTNLHNCYNTGSCNLTMCGNCVTSQSCFTGAMNFDDYIAGVVEGEVAGFPLEAKKAMAVAARTYSLYRNLNGNSGNAGQAFCSNVSNSSISAATSTTNQILLYNGNVCDARNSARCNGNFTQNSNMGTFSPQTNCNLSGTLYPYMVSRACSGHINCHNTVEKPCCNVLISTANTLGYIYGHGVGLCQRGAQGFANSPFNYSYCQILNAFYTNVCISNSNCSLPSGLVCDNDYACSPKQIPIDINGNCIATSCSTVNASPPTQDITFKGGANCNSLYLSSRYDDDVWFSIQPTTANPVTITVTPTSNLSNFDPVVGLYSGQCLSLTQISCGAKNDVGIPEQITFTPTSGVLYLIRVFSYGMGSTYSGNFDICVKSLPSGMPNLTKQTDEQIYSSNNLTVNTTIANTGTANAGSSNTQFVLSLNSDFSTLDYPLGTQNVPPIIAGGSSMQTIDFDLCSLSIPNGEYYLGYNIDYQNAVSNESNENDNSSYWSSPSITIDCNACDLTLGNDISVEAPATSESFSVTSPMNCSWNATKDLCDWLTLTNDSGTGDGQVTFDIEANPDAMQRTCMITVDNKTVLVTQNGTLPSCNGTPSDPINLTAIVYGPLNNSLSWNGSSANVTCFEVERSIDPNGPFEKIAGTGKSFNYFDTDVEAGIKYYYRVRACCIDDCSGYTNTACVKACIYSTASDGITPSTTDICAGESVTLTVEGGMLGTDAEWVWRLNQCNSGPIIGTGTSITIIPANNVPYVVKAEGGCSYGFTPCSVISFGINGSPQPSAITANGSVELCEGSSVMLEGNDGGMWNTGETTPSISVSSTGDYFVTNTNSCGSSESNHILVQVHPSPIADAGIDATICGGNMSPIGSTNNPDYVYDWSPSTGLSNAHISNPFANPNTNTTYVLKVTDSFGCTSFDDINVSVKSGIKVDIGAPQVFKTLPKKRTTTCNTTLDAGNPGSSFVWSLVLDKNDLSNLICNQKINYDIFTKHYLPYPYCVDGFLLDSAHWFATGGFLPSPTGDLAGERLPKALSKNCLDAGLYADQTNPWPIHFPAHPDWKPNNPLCWGPEDVLICSQPTVPKIYPNVAGKYIVTVTDQNGCMSSDSLILTINDNIKPQALIQNTFAYLDGTGKVVITPAMINKGSSDNCGLCTMSVYPSIYTCKNKGPNRSVLTITDIHGNTSTATATINVIDLEPPKITCPPDITVTPPANQCSVLANAVKLGSPSGISDNCAVKYPVTKNNVSNFQVGITNINWTISDSSLNSSTCVQKVIVIPANCGIPIKVMNSDSTSTTAKIKWQAAICASEYQVSYRQELSIGVWAGWSPWVSASGPGLSHQITNLKPNKNYNYSIRTRCGTIFSTEVSGFIHTKSSFNGDLTQRIDSSTIDNVDRENKEISIQVIPNPARESARILIDGFENENKSVTMFDLNGKLIFNLILNKEENEIELDLKKLALHSGIYLIRISDGKSVRTERLIIER